MPSILATSDWHLGAPFGNAQSAAIVFSNQQFITAEKIVAVANESGVNAVFILGDMFDNDLIGKSVLHRTREVLRQSKSPVYILPGNHDWWHTGGSLWSFERLLQPEDDIHIIQEPKPFVLDTLSSVTFFPCPCLKSDQLADPSHLIRERSDDDGIRVGLLHGSLNSVPDGIIPNNVQVDRDLDFVLLGDWHNPESGPGGSTLYCGSPEALGFNEEHRGRVLLLNFTDDGPEPQSREVGQMSWRRIEEKLEPEEEGGLGCSQLREKLDSIDSPKELTAIRLHVRGSLSATELDELTQIIDGHREYGWAEFDTENVDVQELQQAGMDWVTDDLSKVVSSILESDEDDIVKRRALRLLQNRLEAMN